MKNQHRLLIVAAWTGITLGLTIFTGCSNNETGNEEIASTSGDAGQTMRGPGERMSRPNGPGGQRGQGGSGRSGKRQAEPVAANATAPQIFQQKCQGCHGDKGQGARGPELAKVGSRSDAELHQIIRDGHEKMPSFAKQMTPAQIDAVVAYVKKLTAAKPS